MGLAIFWLILLLLLGHCADVYSLPKLNNFTVVERETRYGLLRGKVIDTSIQVQVEEYLGVPYALPPIGQHRFADPRPYEQFPAGLYEAFEFGNACVQLYSEEIPGADPGAPVSEDCLFLNIWIPLPYRSHRAVMVYVHGGAFMKGAGSLQWYSGHMLAAYGDVIVMNVNYRLGVFGFLHTGDSRVPSGNVGLKDQQLALKWIKDNIANFGGDPDLLTMFGQSAGGMSGGLHLMIPGSEHLLTRTIMQSGTANLDLVYNTMEEAAQQTARLATVAGCPNDETLLDCLRDVPANQLYFMSLPPDFGLAFPWVPTIDGVTIPDFPSNLIAQGLVEQKDTLLGLNEGEGSIFLYLISNITVDGFNERPYETYLSLVHYIAELTGISDETTQQVIEAYTPANVSDPDECRRSASDVIADSILNCNVIKFAPQWAELGMKTSMYLLNYRPSNDPMPEWFGTFHGSEVQWVFGVPLWENKNYSDDEYYLATWFMSMWSNFAKYGIANINGSPEWPQFTCSTTSLLEILGPNDYVLHLNHTYRQEYCHLWNYSPSKLQNRL